MVIHTNMGLKMDLHLDPELYFPFYVVPEILDLPKKLVFCMLSLCLLLSKSIHDLDLTIQDKMALND